MLAMLSWCHACNVVVVAGVMLAMKSCNMIRTSMDDTSLVGWMVITDSNLDTIQQPIKDKYGHVRQP